MKKYIFIILLFFLLININISYSYIDNIIYPIEVTTNNLEEYLRYNNIEVYSICSYDRCMKVSTSNYNIIVNNFKDKFNKTLNEQEKIEYDIKGYPITSITLCT